ncbi:MAG: mechanosensitive ion channel [Bacilli bacterium]|nr:mechanosensitive ion channel [Bacilli bacterium]
MSLAEQLRTLLRELLITIIPNQGLVNFIVTAIMILMWVVLAFIVTRLVRIILFNSKSFEKKLGRTESKEQQTVRRLLNNIIQFFFFFWIAVMILSELGLDLIPLLAGAGVLAFAIGFGAQELIKDVIAGMFLILEKTFKIGDYVEIGSQAGTITDVGLRRIKMQNWKGEVITINNGDIRVIKNMSLNPSFAVIEFRADYDFNLKELESADFKNFLNKFKEKNTEVLEMPEKVLLIDLNDGLKFTINIKTKNRKHIGVERDFRRQLMAYFQNKNIDIVVPVVIAESGPVA